MWRTGNRKSLPTSGRGVAFRRARLSAWLERACAVSTFWSGTWRRGRCGRCSGCSAFWPRGLCQRAGKRGVGAGQAVAWARRWAAVGRKARANSAPARTGLRPRDPASTPRLWEGRLRPVGALFPVREDKCIRGHVLGGRSQAGLNRKRNSSLAPARQCLPRL